MRLRPHLFGLSLPLLACLACGSSSSTTTAVVRPELVAVDPDDFLGDLRCALPFEGNADVDAGADASVANLPCTPESASNPDAVRSYVATLFDVTPAEDGGVPNPGVPLSSSAPTSCLKPVTFAFVVAGHRYVAEVDAYHERPECLSPISPGSRLLSNVNGTRVVPRWAATCGGYPPSPQDAGTGGAAAITDAGADAGAPGAACNKRPPGTRPPGVVSYDAVTQTPHDCGCGLQEPTSDSQ